MSITFRPPNGDFTLRPACAMEFMVGSRLREQLPEIPRRLSPSAMSWNRRTARAGRGIARGLDYYAERPNPPRRPGIQCREGVMVNAKDVRSGHGEGNVIRLAAVDTRTDRAIRIH